MLTALEVHGFKSFADRTRFDFPPGITVIVGPNGSGKSNVVDAVKWVLGSQSAKSLRGSEMTDVIFKGSSGGRKQLNTAEATIIFDNADGRLPVEEKEVRVTRRVYRSGEGEYLINGQACRLRDIKDLFRGTGVANGAYSLIEQGKVAALLQASPKDRRAIFEEAAGISRFKAKKIETERRLARVDQNLLRLSDIVDEVESRLRSVRSQASKARRYKQYSDRLQQLRTQVGMADWRHLSERLAEIETQMQNLHAQQEQNQAECETLEAEAQQADARLADVDESLHHTEGQIARNREQLAATQATVEHQRARCADIDAERRRGRRQLASMSHRAGDLTDQLRQTEELVEVATGEYARLCRRVDEIGEQAERLARQLEEANSDLAERRRQHLDLVQRGTELANELTAARSEFNAAQATTQRCTRQREELTAELDRLVQEVAELESHQRTLAANLHEQTRLVEAAHEDLSRAQRRLEKAKDKHVELRDQRARLQERATVLSDLERRREGVHAAVQQVLAQAQSPQPGPYADVCGMLADLIDVHVESASVVEAALGAMAQGVVVRGHDLLEHFCLAQNRPAGRVALLPLEEAPLPIEPAWATLEQQPGVIGRADRFVQTELVYAPLIRHLLGNTWVVESLDVAAHLAELSGDQLRFVTIDGAVLESDGRLVLGAAQQATGLISRRSELRELDVRLSQLEREIDQQAKHAAAIEGEIAETREQLQQLEQLQRQLADDHAAQRAQVQAAHNEQQRVERQLDVARSELQAAAGRQEEAAESIALLEADKQTGDDEAEAIAEQIERAAQLAGQLQAQHKACDLRATSAKVETAKSEERLDALRSRLRQIQRDRHERQKALDDIHRQIAQANQRHDEAEMFILARTTQLAEHYLQKEVLARELASLAGQRNRLVESRRQLADALQGRQRQIQRLEQQRHTLELSAGQLRGERDHMAQRLREDYGIDLADEQETDDAEAVHQREAVEQEIADLRRKINNIGAVNMDALEELEQLEERFNSLSGQFHDLQEAKAALEKIIQRINTDSRRLFSETLEAIRTNFQTLYRKLFGGGHADIVLQEGEDILEAGIEIVANPPGKPAFSNSLLSGGEQGLTAVSLLLALFQHRPSPFCVLDEVDAPLDESNIGRFVDVLREFLQWTRFVIVTHSKKTMTAATTLYGVTMQEPNVSKRVSVRFEDVSAQGEISDDAITRQQAEDAQSPEERGAA